MGGGGWGVKVVTCGVGSFAEQVINVPAKDSVRLLNSHKLPCLRLCSALMLQTHYQPDHLKWQPRPLAV